ncbi:hypothetical protein [Actinoplanes sp. NPDC020271]|uniref:hypothetical protein n=1 Tax=Actinoplanes sp. NPDC020271 TaxID=3363896 RepID=UPI0037B7CCB2
MVGPHRVVRGPIDDVLRELRPSTLVVDVFPAGIGGELTVPDRVRTVLLARLLRGYAGRPVRFDQVWTVEEATLPPGISGDVARLELVDPPAPSLPIAAGTWLIPHAGPASETAELIAYARECAGLEDREPRLLVASPHPPPGDVDHIDVYPVWPLFAGAERVISAAGFNVVRQMRPWRSKHRMLPFARRWDDQFTRAARARREIQR